MGKRAGSYVLCVIVVLAVVNAAEGEVEGIDAARFYMTHAFLT